MTSQPTDSTISSLISARFFSYITYINILNAFAFFAHILIRNYALNSKKSNIYIEKKMSKNDPAFTATRETKDAPINAFGKIGYPVHNWKRRPDPPRTPMKGRTCRLEPLSIDKHARDLFDAFSLDKEGRSWNHLVEGPFPDFLSFHTWLKDIATQQNRLDFAIIDGRTDRAVGTIAYMFINPEIGTMDIGNAKFSPVMQRTTMGTEAVFLMMQRAFDELGYRRCVTRCSAMNTKSIAASERFGLHREGVFRQFSVYKGLLNVDLVWFSIIDSEWPKIRTVCKKWLSPENFDENGNQIQSLSKLRLISKI